MRKLFILSLILLPLLASSVRAGYVTHYTYYNETQNYHKERGATSTSVWNFGNFDSTIPKWNDDSRPLLGVFVSYYNSVRIWRPTIKYNDGFGGKQPYNSTINDWFTMYNPDILSPDLFNGTTNYKVGKTGFDLAYDGSPVVDPGMQGQKFFSKGFYADKTAFIGSGNINFIYAANTSIDFMYDNASQFDYSFALNRFGSIAITYTFQDPPPPSDPTPPPVPEPATIGALACGIVVAGLTRLRRKKD